MLGLPKYTAQCTLHFFDRRARQPTDVLLRLSAAPLTAPPLYSPLIHSSLQGAVDTSFIAKHEAQLLGAEPVPPAVLALAAVAFLQIAVQRAQVSGWAGQVV